MTNLESYYLTEEHELFRKTLRDFLDKEVVPFVDQWEEDNRLPKELFKKFGDMGFFGMTQEEKYGGSNLDFWYDVIFIEEVSKCLSGGFGASISAHPYLSLSHMKHEASDFLKDKYPPFPYTGPSILKMVFPTFKISFCGTGSTVMMDALRYEPVDVERHKNDDVSKKYSMDMQFYVNKLFLSAVKTKMDVNELISTSVQMINIQSSQTPATSGDPAFDHMHLEYLMNKKKYELQYSLSQTSQTEKTVIPLRLDPPGSSRLFNPTVDVVDTNDPDREKGMVMKKGIVTLKAEHSPN